MDRSHQRIRGPQGQHGRGAILVRGRKNDQSRWSCRRFRSDGGKQLAEGALVNIGESDQNRISRRSAAGILPFDQLKPSPGQGSFQSCGAGGGVAHEEDLRASWLLDGRLGHAMKGSKWIS